MKANLSAFLGGLVFALGLGLSGMAQPAVVLAFLDVTGQWNPSLMAVMGGAIGVTLPAYQWLFRHRRPLLAKEFALPTTIRPCLRLFSGSVLFGVGWGLSGYCPGAALVAASGGTLEAAFFTLAMLAGFYLYRKQKALSLSDQPARETP